MAPGPPPALDLQLSDQLLEQGEGGARPHGAGGEGRGVAHLGDAHPRHPLAYGPDVGRVGPADPAGGAGLRLLGLIQQAALQLIQGQAEGRRGQLGPGA